MIVKEVENEKEANLCNSLLEKLIEDEKKYNDNINDEIIINNYYENIYKKDNNKLFVASINDEIIGYIYVKINDPKLNGEKYKEAFIDALYVKDEYRNKGVATSLIKEAKQYAIKKEAKKISINVISDNEIALKLYYKLGFYNFSFRLKQNL